MIVKSMSDAAGQPAAVLVLGGCGFVGRHLVELLVKNGAPKIRVVDKLMPSMAALAPPHKAAFEAASVEFRQADLSRQSGVDKAFADDRNQLQACVYLALSMSRMPETLRALLTASKSWSDAQGNTDDIVQKNFLDLSQSKSTEAFFDLAKRYYIASSKAEVYTKADDAFWFKNSVPKLASGVRGALRRRLAQTLHVGPARVLGTPPT